jgi:hypothetical protein
VSFFCPTILFQLGTVVDIFIAKDVEAFIRRKYLMNGQSKL